MYTQNQFYNPEPLIYRNKHYVRQFLGSSTILILGIIQTITSLLNLFSLFLPMADLSDTISQFMKETTGENVNISFSNSSSFSLMPIAFAVCFYLIYFCARSKRKNSAIKGSVTFFWALCIVQLVLSSLAAAAFTLLISLLAILIPNIGRFMNMSMDQSYTGADITAATSAVSIVLVILLIFLAAITAFMLFYSINQLRFAASIRNSISTPELSAKGAKATGVSYVIFSVFTSLGLVISAIFFFVGLFAPESSLIIFGLPYTKSTFVSIYGISLISNFIGLAYYIYMAKFAFGYNKHILAAGPNGCNLPMPVIAYNPAPEQPVNQATETQFDTTPEAPAQEEETTAQEEETSATPEAECTYEPQPADAAYVPAFCPHCGTPVAEGHSFCSGCGNKLQ